MSATALTPMTAGAADAVLSGTIKSPDGAALGGVTVSAPLRRLQHRHFGFHR